MISRRADGGVTQAVTQRLQPTDAGVDLVRLLRQALAINLRTAISREHAGDLIQRKSGLLAERNQREARQH